MSPRGAVAPPTEDERTDAQRAALELADLYLSAPSVPSEELQARLLDELGSEQVVELVLRLFHYSSNRIRVALGLDIDLGDDS